MGVLSTILYVVVVLGSFLFFFGDKNHKYPGSILVCTVAANFIIAHMVGGLPNYNSYLYARMAISFCIGYASYNYLKIKQENHALATFAMAVLIFPKMIVLPKEIWTIIDIAYIAILFYLVYSSLKKFDK